MKRIAIVLLLLGLLLAGCQTAPAAETGLSGQSPQSETSPTPADTTAPVAVLPAPPDYCLDCHTDQERLTALATKEEDAHGSESEGVG